MAENSSDSLHEMPSPIHLFIKFLHYCKQVGSKLFGPFYFHWMADGYPKGTSKKQLDFLGFFFFLKNVLLFT